MGKLIDIQENKPYKISEVICVKCYWRWIAVRQEVAKLSYLECNKCHEIGYVIETGEMILDE